jgi:DnaA family protein
MSQSVFQLPLGIGIKDNINFDNFYSSGNELLVETLRQSDEQYIYLWGDRSTGKSHLLQAVCHAATSKGLHPSYLPLKESSVLSPNMLDGLEQTKVVVLDDIEAIAGQPDWEEGIFALYNAVKDEYARLIVSSYLPPSALKLQLADLLSRLSWGPVFKIEPLHDGEKCAALQMRAKQRGLILEDDVADYMIKRCPRDMESLFNLLNKLDQASMVAKRRLTIPFVRTLL